MGFLPPLGALYMLSSAAGRAYKQLLHFYNQGQQKLNYA